MTETEEEEEEEDSRSQLENGVGGTFRVGKYHQRGHVFFFVRVFLSVSRDVQEMTELSALAAQPATTSRKVEDRESSK